MNLKPLGNRLVVEPVEKDSMTPGGIALPESAKEAPIQGRVLAAGPGALKEDGGRVGMDVGVGDMILYPKYTGIEVKVGGGPKRLILKESDVLAIVSS